MRTALRFTLTGATVNASVQVAAVRTPMYRDFWLRVRWTGAEYAVEAYDTRAEAEAGAPMLASGTANAGDSLVTMTEVGGARFDPTPMEVEFASLSAGGTFTDALFGYVAGTEEYLIERVSTILQRYMTENEALDGFEEVVLYDAEPINMPYVGVSVAGMLLGTQAGAGGQAGWYGIDLYAANAIMDQNLAAASVMEVAGVLRSIALDEQRTWGGWAQDTQPRGALTPLVEKIDGGGFLYRAIIPVTIQLWDVPLQVEPGSPPSPVGGGGKYVSGL